MDPATLATTALTILTPFAKGAGNELMKAVGENTAHRVRDLFAWLKQRFAGDPVAAKDLSRFEAAPDKFEPALLGTIQEKAEQDPEFAAELKNRIDEVGPMIAVFQEFKKGKDVTGVEAGDIRSGKVSVRQKADEAEGMTGFRAKTVG
ncbi:MAG TPA: hypothetical protein VK335_02765 [Bryobacteraceae bacterium]|nr:hypothetical protein [Bryobacteraceae bacterium]